MRHIECPISSVITSYYSVKTFHEIIVSMSDSKGNVNLRNLKEPKYYAIYQNDFSDISLVFNLLLNANTYEAITQKVQNLYLKNFELKESDADYIFNIIKDWFKINSIYIRNCFGY